MNLSEVKNLEIKTSYRIVDFNGAPEILDRLFEMGLSRGLVFDFMGSAPFGGPVLIHYHSSFLALRKNEAACAIIEKVI